MLLIKLDEYTVVISRYRGLSLFPERTICLAENGDNVGVLHVGAGNHGVGSGNVPVMMGMFVLMLVWKMVITYTSEGTEKTETKWYVV